MKTMEEGEEEVMRGHEEKIYVTVRLRPLNEKEISSNDVTDWECINDNTIIYKSGTLSASERSMYPTAYTFDRIFRSDCSTRQVYEEAAREVALCVVSGINSSVFAYGQTSSGKTYTMTGITEYAIADIYEYVHKHREREFILKFSAMEIYNESVRDLLGADNAQLRLLDDLERGTVVEKLTEEILRDWNHVINLLSICEAQRQIGETALNETSSRSHQIIRLTVESAAREFLGKDNLSTLSATVNFVDLAGSERASQSLSAGTRLKEGCHINRSLLTLGTVIRKLSKARNGHIPYRDSKLTRILQPSLGGNARTAIICTLSPARSHVEQSRNTLLFASCAKEVTTSAQVNVVMSDKALLKHLQRELARLESQLKNPSSDYVLSDYAVVLKEKDLQIEKLEKEVKELILQRDIAQSQLKDFLQMLGDDGNLLMQGGFGHYPNLRVRKSPDFHNPVPETSSYGYSPSVDVDVRTLSDTHSRSSYEDNVIHVPDFEQSYLHNDVSSRLSMSGHSFAEVDSYRGWDEIEKQSHCNSDELFKEVRCIETEDSSFKGHFKSSSSPDENNGFPSQMTIENGISEDQESPLPLTKPRGLDTPSLKEEGEITSIPSKDDQELLSTSLGNDKECVSKPSSKDQDTVSSSLKGEKQLIPSSSEEEKELSCIHFSDVRYEKSSSDHELKKQNSSSRSLIKSRSCKASLTVNESSSWFEKVEDNENTPPSGVERKFIARPEGFNRNVSPLNFDKVGRFLDKYSESSMKTAANTKREASNEKSSNDEKVVNVEETKEIPEVQHENEVPGSPVKETQEMASKASKSVKDVGLDPIEDDMKSFSSWPLEFKRLQREIIELWHACCVSLVHRTYFFLLFQGDPSDAIYMEVELRRLTFLKDTFTRGERTIVNGRTLTLASSMKALRQERRMLSKHMLKKLSEQERDGLFLKWGIGINTKLRRLQLAHRLWTKTDDLNHINDSAFLVANLVGLIEPGKAPKEMFGLNFAPRSTSRSYSFKRSLISLV